MPPAGYCASKAVGTMNLYLAILMGIIGSWLGALLNYYLAAWLGRPFFLKYGKYFFCPPEKFEKIDAFFRAHGEISTFTGRLLPAVRHYISLSAGLTRMNRLHFLLYTGLGAGIWCAILAVIGYYLGENKDLVFEYSKRAGIWVIVFCVALVAAYIWLHRRKKKPHRPALTQDAP